MRNPGEFWYEGVAVCYSSFTSGKLQSSDEAGEVNHGIGTGPGPGLTSHIGYPDAPCFQHSVVFGVAQGTGMNPGVTRWFMPNGIGLFAGRLV